MSDTLNLASNSSHYKNFLEVGCQIKEIASLLGKEVEPVHHKDRPCFLKLPEADQAAVIERLKIYKKIFESIAAELDSGVNEKKLLWIALKLLNLAPSSDLMNMISETDLVEVFVGYRQVYRSFNYYDFCSYSFDELESTTWDKLFFREDSRIFDLIMQETSELIRTRKTIISATPEHIVREISSPFLNKVNYKLKYIVPIKDLESNRSDCYVAILSAKLLETVPKEKRIEKMMRHQNSQLEPSSPF